MPDVFFRKYWIICNLLTWVLLFAPASAVSQTIPDLTDTVYGPDQSLCNGKKYTFFLPPGTKGHQFLLYPYFMPGGTSVLGNRFDHLLLNYDIVNQQVLLNYMDDRHIPNIIVLNPSWMDDFQLADMHFEHCPFGDSARFCQVLGEDTIKILYLWKKELRLEASIGTNGYVFSDAMREPYLQINGVSLPYKSNHGMVRLFRPEQQKEVKSYLKSQRINVKKASDKEMIRFLTFLNQLK
jgi:hypothetical protein